MQVTRLRHLLAEIDIYLTVLKAVLDGLYGVSRVGSVSRENLTQ